jgi:signal peptide peptidase SppA
MSDKPVPLRVLGRLADAHWAIRREQLEEMLSIASRSDVQSTIVQALAAQPTRALTDTTSMVVRNGVAVIPFIGPAFRYASFFTEICGATSYERTMLAFQSALDDPKVKSILFEIDSPGGEVTGCGELAQAIFNARGSKPIVAYVGGEACSAAYWVASACDHIVAAPTAVLGCLGVVGVYTDRTAADEKAGVRRYEIVSSQTPNKRPDMTTKAGRDLVQAQMDSLADVFLGDVATYRGVSPDQVAKQFGEGGVFIGADAVEAGLADELGNLEETISDLTSNRKSFLEDTKSGSKSHGNLNSRAAPAAASKDSIMGQKLRAKVDAVKASGAADDEDEAAIAAAVAAVNGEKVPVAKKGEGEKMPAPAKTDDSSDDEDDSAKTDEMDDGDGPDDESDPKDKEEDKKQKATAPSAGSDPKARIRAILEHDEAKGRDDLAKHLAFDTDLDVDACAKLMAVSPRANAAPAKRSLSADMRSVPNPRVGAAADKGQDIDEGDELLAAAKSLGIA